MTPEEQRIAIAEACGWTFHPPPYNPPPHSVEFKAEALACWVKPGNPPHQKGFPPDYLNDLNAMNEVERVLKAMPHDGGIFTPWERYARTLVSELGTLDAIHATAAQRSEVFLHTVGKWKD